MVRTLLIPAAAIGLSAALMTAAAIADHKPKHDPGGGGGGGDGGGDATYEIALTNDLDGNVVAAGVGVDGPGRTIDGITELGSFEGIALASLSTQEGDSNVQLDYNQDCGDVVNDLHASEAIDDIRVVHDFEIDTLTVPVEYTVTDEFTLETQSFTLLLQGPYPAELDFPPTDSVELTMWNNRGGGKGTKNRCGSGFQVLDGVTLTIVPTSP